MSDRVLLSRMPYWRKMLSVAPDALIAYWPLYEPSGTVVINRQGDAARNGVYTGVDLNYPGIGDGLSAPFFDGVNDYANIYSAALNSAFNAAEGTIQIWGRLTAAVWTDATYRQAMMLRADANNRLLIEREPTNDQIVYYYIAGGTLKSVALTTSRPITPFHLALTWSKSADQMKAYFNGVQVGATQTGLGTWAGALASTACLIGAVTTTPTFIWSGMLAHAGVWTRALSAGEVAELYRIA